MTGQIHLTVVLRPDDSRPLTVEEAAELVGEILGEELETDPAAVAGPDVADVAVYGGDAPAADVAPTDGWVPLHDHPAVKSLAIWLAELADGGPVEAETALRTWLAELHAVGIDPTPAGVPGDTAATAGPTAESGTRPAEVLDLAAVEALLARSGADATDHELRQVVALVTEVRQLRDRHARGTDPTAGPDGHSGAESVDAIERRAALERIRGDLDPYAKGVYEGALDDIDTLIGKLRRARARADDLVQQCDMWHDRYLEEKGAAAQARHELEQANARVAELEQERDRLHALIANAHAEALKWAAARLESLATGGIGDPTRSNIALLRRWAEEVRNANHSET